MTLGIEKLLADLRDLGYTNVSQVNGQGQPYAVIPDFEITGGTFNGRIIGLGIPAPGDFPRGAPSSIHINAMPVLLTSNIPGKVNMQGSQLGPQWQYWSFRFILNPQNATMDLVAKINDIFRKL